jgi:ribosomal protein L29
MKNELTKTKKTLREKEKELSKVKGELATFKVQKITANSENTAIIALASATNNP